MDWETAYNNRAFIPGGDDYPPRWEAEAQEFRALEASLGRARLNAPYGTHDREKFDLFHPATGAAQGLMVFVHGGYWRLFDRGYWSHFSRGCLARGWAVAVPSYVLCPDVRLPEITAQVATAVSAAGAMVAGPIVLAGHSAGGHLAARMANPGVLPPEIAARIRAIAPISPLSDLRPMLNLEMNADLGLTPESAAAESPILIDKALDVPVSVWVGAEERPVFLDQARWLAEAWDDTELFVAPGRHHFDVIDLLLDPESRLVNQLTH